VQLASQKNVASCNRHVTRQFFVAISFEKKPGRSYRTIFSGYRLLVSMRSHASCTNHVLRKHFRATCRNLLQKVETKSTSRATCKNKNQNQVEKEGVTR